MIFLKKLKHYNSIIFKKKLRLKNYYDFVFSINFHSKLLILNFFKMIFMKNDRVVSFIWMLYFLKIKKEENWWNNSLPFFVFKFNPFIKIIIQFIFYKFKLINKHKLKIIIDLKGGANNFLCWKIRGFFFGKKKD